jgi:hypothetical protein
MTGIFGLRRVAIDGSETVAAVGSDGTFDTGRTLADLLAGSVERLLELVDGVGEAQRIDPDAATLALARRIGDGSALGIRLTIGRGGQVAFDGRTSTATMHRTFDDLRAYLFRELSHPSGVEPEDVVGLAALDPVERIDLHALGLLRFPGGILPQIACSVALDQDDHIRA